MSKLIQYDIDTEEYAFLKSLLLTCSPSGQEYEAIQIVKRYLKESCILYTDVMGNLYATASENENVCDVMLCAHIDEVGFQITKVTQEGFVYLRRLGGLDRQTMPGTTLCVARQSRDIVGVFGKTSPHVQKETEKSQSIEQDALWVDFGFNLYEQAKKYISVGDYVGVMPSFQTSIDGESVVSKGLDNKISVFILAALIKRLAAKNELPQNITFVFTVQEEIGCRGSIIASQRLKPQIAICLDVGITTDIPSMRHKTDLSEFVLGKGPGLCVTPDNNPILVDILKKCAVDNGIPFQITTCLRPAGGTETARIQLECCGISTAHISIPNRYMHSAVEMCRLCDAAYTINLLQKCLKILSVTPRITMSLF